jgi:hypothetical protein
MLHVNTGDGDVYVLGPYVRAIDHSLFKIDLKEDGSSTGSEYLPNYGGLKPNERLPIAALFTLLIELPIGLAFAVFWKIGKKKLISSIIVGNVVSLLFARFAILRLVSEPWISVPIIMISTIPLDFVVMLDFVVIYLTCRRELTVAKAFVISLLANLI